MRALPVFVAVLIVIAAAWFFLLRPDNSVQEPVADTATAEADMQSEADASSAATAEDEEPLPEVVTLTTNVDEIVSMFENAAWVHRGETGPVR